MAVIVKGRKVLEDTTITHLSDRSVIDGRHQFRVGSHLMSLTREEAEYILERVRYVEKAGA